eukprot:scaffold133945_cov36-Cyclotella_meneghiniana.AAC.4
MKFPTIALVTSTGTLGSLAVDASAFGQWAMDVVHPRSKLTPVICSTRGPVTLPQLLLTGYR